MKGAFFSAGVVAPIQAPFIADSSGCGYLVPATSNRITMKIKWLASVEQEQLDLYSHVTEMPWKDFAVKQHLLAAGKNRTEVQNGKRYSLYYWDKDWILLTTVTGVKGWTEFKRVPANCLYKVAAVGSAGNERVFTYRNGKQRWW